MLLTHTAQARDLPFVQNVACQNNIKHLNPTID